VRDGEIKLDWEDEWELFDGKGTPLGLKVPGKRVVE
jgi:hypothetical protein